MATKSAQQTPEKSEAIEEALDHLDTTLERLKVLYEQYFLGIQKQPPAHLHTDVERKLRDLTQMQIRNTALRYRFATMQQKFGSYNSYWRRTLRQIENGTYARNLSKIGREAARTGADIPDEILAAMPKRMREQVLRDREVALAIAARRKKGQGDGEPNAAVEDDEAAIISSPNPVGEMDRGGAYLLDDSEDIDVDAFFQEIQSEPDVEAQLSSSSIRSSPPARPSVPAAPAAPPAATSRPGVPAAAPSQASRPNPIAPGSYGATAPVAVQSMDGTFARPPAGSAHSPSAESPPPHPGSTTARLAGVASSPRAPAQAPSPPSGVPARPASAATPPGGVPARPASAATPPGGVPARPASAATPPGGVPARPASAATPPGGTPTRPASAATPPGGVPARPASAATPPGGTPTRPASAATPPGGVPTRQGGAATVPSAPAARPIAAKPATPAPGPAKPAAPMRPPAGMSDADVNALYAKYVKAKELVGEQAGPGAYSKLLKTINAQAPKIMEQYKAKGVDFSIVVKDNQVIIKAKPKT
ncbi:MAG: MXAN_5187 C-terminal domain-containing protein [Kofleriaceae bacterium]